MTPKSTAARRMRGKEPMPRCALFVQYTAEFSGSPISGLAVVEALKSSGLRVEVVFGVDGPLQKDYRDKGCTVRCILHGQWLAGGTRLQKARRWIRELRATWRFAALIRRRRPEFVYVNTLMSIAAVIAARLNGVPVVWHLRELFEDAGGEMRWPLGGRLAVRVLVRKLPTRIVCVSEAVMTNVLGVAPSAKAVVIYNPLTASYFERPWSSEEARAALGISREGFLVGLPGTLRPVKGHDFFIDTAARMLGQDPTYSFAVSGELDNAYARHVVERCQDLGIQARFYFVGALSDMRVFYAACDVVCVPSRSESFGRTAIEAFAQRRPVIATRTGGLPEVVTNGDSGILVNYGDCSALADAIHRLRVHGDVREHLVRRGWDRAVTLFHESAFARQLLEVIQDVSRDRGTLADVRQ